MPSIEIFFLSFSDCLSAVTWHLCMLIERKIIFQGSVWNEMLHMIIERLITATVLATLIFFFSPFQTMHLSFSFYCYRVWNQPRSVDTCPKVKQDWWKRTVCNNPSFTSQNGLIYHSSRQQNLFQTVLRDLSFQYGLSYVPIKLITACSKQGCAKQGR